MDFTGRLGRFKEQLAKKHLDGVIVSSPAHIAYLTGYSNFSIEEREAFVFVTKKEGFILTDGRYAEAVKKEVPHLKLIEISHKNPTKKVLAKLSKMHQVKKMGIEEGNLTVAEYKNLSKIFKLTDFKSRTYRSVKETAEVESIKKACDLADKAYEYILKRVKPGVSEKEIAFELELFIKKRGAKLSFDPIIAFGGNCAIPHHQTGQTTLTDKNGQFILMDFGAKVGSYCSDMTRVVFWGKPSRQQRKMYQAVLEAHQKAVDFITANLEKPIKVSEVSKVTNNYLVAQGYPPIPHSLGHGVGLEIHEHPYLSPKSKEVLKEGMVFSIEPGVYFPQENSRRAKREVYLPGIGGVRLEDLYTIQHGKLVQLTKSPKRMMVLEN